MARVSIIGTGNMGRHMARHLLEAGYRLTVHDARRAATEQLEGAGAGWAESPAELAEASDVVFTEQTAMPANGTVEDTLAWVGTDKARAQQALAAENAKATPRTTLIGQLQQILAS